MRAKKLSTIFAIAIGLAVLLIFASCSQPAEEKESQTVESEVPGTSQETNSDDLYLPEIVELEDGTLIQRTPDEQGITLDGSYTYHTPEETVSYNTYYLKADERGCNACHEDLAQLLDDITYDHVKLTNSYGIQLTVQMCKDCHTFGYGYQTNQYSFGTLIHGIHNTDEIASCWNCHVGTGSGVGMQLWDEAKHGELRGINPVADVSGDFTYNKDKTTPVADLFDFGWNYFELDYLRTENDRNDVPLDQEMFDTWTITISGAVEQEITYTLPEIIEKFESVTLPLTFHCTLNPTGGPLIGNSVYTGVPLSQLFEASGIDPDAGAFTILAPDGFIEPVQMANFTEAYICYEIDGEPLPWKQGYPVQLIVPHSGAPASVKQVSDIIVNTAEEATELHEWNGWPNEAGDGNFYTPTGWPFVDDNGYKNKPNVALFDFNEGQIIETGQPYTFTGYATAWDERIAALEFSMDGGATWTRYETPDISMDNWVIWNFAYTPEFDSAYVLSIRAVTDQGRVTEEPIEVMFNAKSE